MKVHLGLPSQQSTVLQAQKTSGGTQNSYQLVVDPRLGLIVGTVAPSTSTATVSPQSAQQPTASNATAAVAVQQQQQQRKRGRRSIVKLPQVQQPAPQAKPPPPKVGAIFFFNMHSSMLLW